MTVNPGFGGQRFIPGTLAKVETHSGLDPRPRTRRRTRGRRRDHRGYDCERGPRRRQRVRRGNCDLRRAQLPRGHRRSSTGRFELAPNRPPLANPADSLCGVEQTHPLGCAPSCALAYGQSFCGVEQPHPGVALLAASALSSARWSESTRMGILTEVSRRFGFGAWRSLVARFVRDEEVAGSNPVAPTRFSLIGTKNTGLRGPHSLRDSFTRIAGNFKNRHATRALTL